MFRPRDSYDQRLISSEMHISPEPKRVRWFHDVFGNCVAVASFGAEAKELAFDTRIVLDHTPSNAPDFVIEDYAKTYPFTYGAEERGHLPPDRAPIPRPRAPARQVGPPVRPLRPAHRHGRAADDPDLRHQGELHLLQALRARHAGPAADAVVRQGHLSRLRGADDGGRAHARLRGAIRVGLPLCPARPGGGAQGRRQHPRLVPGLPAGSRMGGVRPDQRHRGEPGPHPRRGGRATRARRSRSRAAISATPPTMSACRCRSTSRRSTPRPRSPGRTAVRRSAAGATGPRSPRPSATRPRPSWSRPDAGTCRSAPVGPNATRIRPASPWTTAVPPPPLLRQPSLQRQPGPPRLLAEFLQPRDHGLPARARGAEHAEARARTHRSEPPRPPRRGPAARA